MSTNISDNISDNITAIKCNMSCNMSCITIILPPGIKSFAYPKMSDILDYNFSIEEYNDLIQIANVQNLWKAIDEDSNRNECGWFNSLIRICTIEDQN
jgi:hypothetical protein